MFYREEMYKASQFLLSNVRQSGHELSEVLHCPGTQSIEEIILAG